ncbi:unnamed protein product [Adineta steineri]|uniref:NAD(+)--protein-arginine ADP-ribosyltransferase n=2 Tax=Adineta steineri TaxID=433720 RepID=A0A819VAL5_9BILA|nr:unnamed protein product [Adineta steineri]
MTSVPNMSGLYLACRNNDIETVRTLLPTMTLADINKKESNGSTALHAASYHGHIEIITLLLKRGASRSICNQWGCMPYEEARTQAIKDLFKRRIGNTRFIAGSGATEWICFNDQNAYDRSVFSEVMEKSPLDTWRVDWIKEFYVDKDMSDIEGIDVIREFYELARTNPLYLIKAYSAETDYYRLLNLHLANTNSAAQNSPIDEDRSRWYRLRDLVQIFASHDDLKPYIFKGRVFRGMHLTQEELEAYEMPLKRKIIRHAGQPQVVNYIVNKSFLSTSKDYETAKEFALQAAGRRTKNGELIKFPTVCIYCIRSDNRIALDIEAISEYAHEREVLILPGQTFEVISIRKNIQTSDGLYNGAWISQQIVRDVNKGEYLIHHVTPQDYQQRRSYGGGDGGDPLATLTALKFSYIAWDHQNACQPQFPAYCSWIKRCLLQGFPVMFRTKFNKSFGGHIMPITGIDYSNKNTYDERDTIYYYSLYNGQIIKQPLSELGSDPAARPFYCNWGCIPLDVCWGIAITGILDEDKVCLPVRLTVTEWDEPCVADGEEARGMIGQVTVQELTAGIRYILLRYSSYVDVPISGDAAAFLTSKYTSKHDFTAHDHTYIYEDPIAINSNGSTYYRCVADPLAT